MKKQFPNFRTGRGYLLARCSDFSVIGGIVISCGLAYFLLFICFGLSFRASATEMPSVLNFGDSLTLESNADLAASLGSQVDLYNVVKNAEESANGLQKINDWLTDPDGNPSTPAPAEWDLVRFNHGIHDAVPFTWTGSQITNVTGYINNITGIVSAIRSHSPNATIVFSTSPLIDPNRATLDPPPFTGLIDYAAYNAALTSYRQIVLSTLPGLGVVVDDKYGFYSEYSPSDFPSLPSPSHLNTGSYWHWDGMHFDQSYRAFEAKETASVILSQLFSPDFNLDGSVGGDDLSLWESNVGLFGTARFGNGDADNDRDVDGDDFLAWQRAVAGGEAPLQTVPEPSGSRMLVLITLIFVAVNIRCFLRMTPRSNALHFAPNNE